MQGRRTLLAWACASAAGCAAPAPVRPPPGAPVEADLPAAEMPPTPPSELRAAWVATVANIDWPSRPGLPTTVQQAEALALLDTARRIGLNALVLQVRPAADALYASALEPWSEFLTGQQGRAPQPAWDPLAFWVDEAHRRGLELHAWFNPYRARPSSARTPLALPHAALRTPGLARRYGDQLWLDPAEPAAAALLLDVVSDVVRRYDIDGVHLDDYFYPYPVTTGGVEQPFPDDGPWLRYLQTGGALQRDDWRRSHVDALVQALYGTVKRIKPWVRVGISPFGIGRPGRRPPGVTGFSQYDKLYADVEKWLAAGWLDYLAPQLYWPIDRPGQPFGPLLDRWVAENTAGKHLWPGLYTSQLGKPGWPARELLEQVALLRSRAGPGSGSRSGSGAPSGHIHFSMVALAQDRDGIATLLQMLAYAEPALVPALPSAVGAGVVAAPPAPLLAEAGEGRLRIDPQPGAPVRVWALWRRMFGQWRFAVQPVGERAIDTAGADAVAVAAVGLGGVVGERTLRRLRG